MQERWLTLLAHWQDKEFRHSLTIPFIVGALRNPIGSVQGHQGKGREEVECLLESIARYQSDSHYLHLYHCEDRAKLVLTRVRGSPRLAGRSHVIPRDGPAGVFYASHLADAREQVPLDVVAERIWSEGGDAIESGRFSCRGKMFQEFDPAEIDFICRALA